MSSKKYTVYLPDDAAKRLEAETSAKASPGAVIKSRLLEAWFKEDMAPFVPKSIQTDSIFTRVGDEIKLHVSDNDMKVLAEGNLNERVEEPVPFTSADHAKVLMAINGKHGQFIRSEIAKATNAPGFVVDEVIKSLLFNQRIRKVSYNTYGKTNCEIKLPTNPCDEQP